MSQPWFACYVNDLLGSLSWRCMTPAQRGAYWQLICCQMQSMDGMLPADPGVLSRLAELPLDGEHSIVLEKFPLNGDGKRANPRAYTEWLKRQDIGEKRSKAGAIGGSSKKQVLSKPEANASILPPILLPTITTTSTGTENTPQNTPPTPRKRGKRPPADAGENDDPFGWVDFARLYPGFRLKPDKAAKAWFRRNVTDTEEGRVVLAQIIGNVGQWLKSEQWLKGVVPNCSTYLDENIWQGAPGPPPYRSMAEQPDIFKGCEPWENS